MTLFSGRFKLCICIFSISLYPIWYSGGKIIKIRPDDRFYRTLLCVVMETIWKFYLSIYTQLLSLIPETTGHKPMSGHKPTPNIPEQVLFSNQLVSVIEKYSHRLNFRHPTLKKIYVNVICNCEDYIIVFVLFLCLIKNSAFPLFCCVLYESLIMNYNKCLYKIMVQNFWPRVYVWDILTCTQKNQYKKHINAMKWVILNEI
jgi:hypothetical protein